MTQLEFVRALIGRGADVDILGTRVVV